MQRKLHQTIRRVTEDFGGRWHFNTSIAAIMELLNKLYAYEDSVQRGEAAAPLALLADAQRKLVLMLAPFAPYLAHELWEMLGETSDLLRAPWPQVRSRTREGRGGRDRHPGEWQGPQPHRCSG